MKRPETCEAAGCTVARPQHRCHCSACLGETFYCEKHKHNHKAQTYLDEKGYGSNYFGEEHEKILQIVDDLLKGAE